MQQNYKLVKIVKVIVLINYYHYLSCEFLNFNNGYLHPQFP